MTLHITSWYISFSCVNIVTVGGSRYDNCERRPLRFDANILMNKNIGYRHIFCNDSETLNCLAIHNYNVRSYLSKWEIVGSLVQLWITLCEIIMHCGLSYYIKLVKSDIL